MPRLALIAALVLAPLAAANAAPAPEPVRIDTGLLQGVADGADAIAYKGVPYAAAPTGPLRWRPPQPAARWSGVRDAAAFGAICPQEPGMGIPPGAVQSEDCLFLNVWAPAAPHRGAPVLVWIHGGGDDQGAASQAQFDGAPFARDGIVFVSIDYRLGALGWFAHPALTREAGTDAPLANYGLMDQIAALQWVRRNVRAFGGDPARVTAAGESAGGEAVEFLMATPAARGLFARAIVESGGVFGYPSLAEAEAQGVALATRAGAPAGADAVALRALPAAALISADEGVGATIDGRLVPAAPARVFAVGGEARVPLLIGSNNGEDSLIGGGDPRDVLKDFAPDQLAALRQAYGAEASDDAALGRLVFRDEYFGAPSRRLAALHAARAPTFLYRFDYVPQVLRQRRLRAGHGFEMLFAIEALDRAPIPLPATADDQREMSLVHACWVGFARDGRPGCGVGAPWPAYAPATDQLLLFGPDAARTARTPDAAADDLLNRIAAAPLGDAKRAGSLFEPALGRVWFGLYQPPLIPTAPKLQR